ncbi:MAG: DUF427 domain-containing protein [Blastocatellales bacterium]
MKIPNRIIPLPGQESVWDYPRPPRLEISGKRIRVIFKGIVIADSTQAMRVLETSHPPVYYIPPADVRMDLMVRTNRSSYCEWKGPASYWSIVTESGRSENAAWSYDSPTSSYSGIAGYLAFYPTRVDACYVDEEQVTAQPGDFYGGWITGDIVGPFKGDPETWGW